MTFTAIDLSQVAAPEVVETLDFEEILADMQSDLAARLPDMDSFLESDPGMKLLEVAAYRELLLRQRINEAAKAVMLAYAAGTDLENLAALFGVERLQISAADTSVTPALAAVYESDSELRNRVQLSLEGLSTAGPEGAYIYHALSASGEVLDASAISPSPGNVLVTLLSRSAPGQASAELLELVSAAISDESVRPLTDYVEVQSASIVEYQISASLFFYSGPDREVIMDNARSAAQAYADEQHKLGRDVTLSGLYAALHQSGVQRVELQNPSATISIDRQSASYCTAIELTDGGIDE